MHECVCVLSVCPEINHRNFLITQKQAAFWVLVVPPTTVFVWHWICIHTHIHTCTHTRLRGTPDSLKNEAVFSPSRYNAFVRRSNCQAERKPTAFLTLCPKFKCLYYWDIWVRVICYLLLIPFQLLYFIWAHVMGKITLVFKPFFSRLAVISRIYIFFYEKNKVYRV